MRTLGGVGFGRRPFHMSAAAKMKMTATVIQIATAPIRIGLWIRWSDGFGTLSMSAVLMREW